MPCLWIPAANSNNQQHDINEHYVLRHFYRQTTLYAAIVSSRPLYRLIFDTVVGRRAVFA